MNISDGTAVLPQTLPQMIFGAVERLNKPDVLNYRSGKDWIAIKAEEIIERVKNIALGLKSLGIGAGDRIALISENRPEWSLTDLAILCLRAVNVPIYTTQAIEQIQYILEDSGARMLFVSGKKIYKHAAPAIEGFEPLEKVIFFDEDAIPNDFDNALAISEIERRGAELHRREPFLFNQLLEEIQPSDLATIIYTSGTTGEPKGVMLEHRNFTSNIEAIAKGIDVRSNDISLCVLPLSHIFERVVFYLLMVRGVAVHYCSSFDQLAEFLGDVRPTIMTAVPRLFEAVYHKIVKKGMAAGGWKTSLFSWSLEVGQEYWDYKEKGDSVPLSLHIKHAVANRLVYSKWRAGVGGRLRFFVSGGAPLSRKLSYAYWSAGIPILQGYGMTEACVVSANRLNLHKVASIGTAFDGVDVKIAEDGEILVKSPSLMRGYFNKPEATADVFTEDGFYMTGDVGYIDTRDGHIYITDRKKDLFKLSNGKYIAPLQLESLMKQVPYVSQAVAVGAGRKQTGALVVPEWDSLKSSLSEKGIETAGKSREEICQMPEVIKFVQRDVTEATRELAEYERIKKVALLPQEFSIDKGEMTPTLKIKRAVIDERYGEIIDRITGGTGE